jgi:hypothetical protein
MSLKNRLSKIEKNFPKRDIVYFLGWADCEWREAEGFVRTTNESIEGFKERVLVSTSKQFIWVK